MIAKIGLPLLLLATASVSAADKMPKPGSYGFNWLDPKGSSCKKMTDKDLAAAKCTATDNAFGLEVKSHACKVNARVEYIVYKIAAECQEAFETMQSNGD